MCNSCVTHAQHSASEMRFMSATFQKLDANWQSMWRTGQRVTAASRDVQSCSEWRSFLTLFTLRWRSVFHSVTRFHRFRRFATSELSKETETTHVLCSRTSSVQCRKRNERVKQICTFWKLEQNESKLTLYFLKVSWKFPEKVLNTQLSFSTSRIWIHGLGKQKHFHLI